MYFIPDRVQNNIFRLHIIANSDSDYDQNIKILVRNSIIEYMNKNQVTSDFKTISKEENLYSYLRIEDINELNVEIIARENNFIEFKNNLEIDDFVNNDYNIIGNNLSKKSIKISYVLCKRRSF